MPSNTERKWKKFKTYLATALLLLTVLSTFWLPYFVVQILGEAEIQKVGTEIGSKNSNHLSIINAIIEWEDRNFEGKIIYKRPHSSIPPLYFLLDRIPVTYLRLMHPQWIMFFKHGACEEFARLFVELAKTAGIDNARVVYNLGLDHAWAEVKINGDWIHVDPSKTNPATGKRGIINDPAFYERPENENGGGEQLFFVYAVDDSGTAHDVTTRYVKRTGKLIISVRKENEPVPNARVRVVRTRSSAPFLTDENGACVFNLGEGEYKIIIESGGMIGYRAEKVVKVTAGKTSYENVFLSEFTFLSSFKVLITNILVWFVFLLLFYVVLSIFFPKEKETAKRAILQIFQYKLTSKSISSALLGILTFIYVATITSGLYIILALLQNLDKNIWAIFVMMSLIFFAERGIRCCICGIQFMENRQFRNMIGVVSTSGLIGLFFIFFYGGIGFIIGPSISILSIASIILVLIVMKVQCWTKETETGGP